MGKRAFNTNKKLEKAVKLAALEDFINAEKLAKQCLQQDERNIKALNLLGVICYRTSQIDLALCYYNAAYKLAPDNPAMITNMGTALSARKETCDKAELCFKKALLLNPNYIPAMRELCVLYMKIKEYKKAEALLHEAVQEKKINDILLLKTFSEVYMCMGKIKEYQHYLDATLKHLDDFITVTRKIDLCIKLQELDTVIEMVNNYASNRNYSSLEVSKLYVNLAIVYYLKGDWKNFEQAMGKAAYVLNYHQYQCPPDTSPAMWSSFANFYRMLLYLREYFKDPAHQALRVNEEGYPFIYLIGDSHALYPNSTLITYQKIQHKVEARFVMGLKAYHLANEEENLYKSSFVSAIEQLPRGSTAIISVGEIDCRINEGIIEYYDKNPEINLQSYIVKMVSSYGDYVLESAKSNDITVIFYGIPAPREDYVHEQENFDSFTLTKERIKTHQHIVEYFNIALKHYADIHQCDFIDIYCYTNDRNGHASGQYHIDSNHLYPHILQNLFAEFTYC